MARVLCCIAARPSYINSPRADLALLNLYISLKLRSTRERGISFVGRKVFRFISPRAHCRLYSVLPLGSIHVYIAFKYSGSREYHGVSLLTTRIIGRKLRPDSNALDDREATIAGNKIAIKSSCETRRPRDEINFTLTRPITRHFRSLPNSRRSSA